MMRFATFWSNYGKSMKLSRYVCMTDCARCIFSSVLLTSFFCNI